MKTSELTGRALNWAVSKAHGDMGLVPVAYSTDWAFGGPIIEREGIRVEPEAFSGTGFKSWRADIPKGPTSPHGYKWLFGPTPLIASMRCYVASKLGDEVEIPAEVEAA